MNDGLLCARRAPLTLVGALRFASDSCAIPSLMKP